tara:strand:+ start:1725 stop:2252 length:528 start_codon:yes stop_codon:yes gene_type:complete
MEQAAPSHSETVQKKGFKRFFPFQKKTNKTENNQAEPKKPKLSWLKKTFVGDSLAGNNSYRRKNRINPNRSKQVLAPKVTKNKFVAVKPAKQSPVVSSETYTIPTQKPSPKKPSIKQNIPKYVASRNQPSSQAPLAVLIQNIRNKHSLKRSIATNHTNKLTLSEYIQKIKSKHQI